MKKNALLVFLAISLFNVINPAGAQSTAAPDKPSSRTIEDGGTGPYKALMLTETTLATHTVFQAERFNCVWRKKQIAHNCLG
jgi:hypothetical protein